MKVGKWFGKREAPVIYDDDVLVNDEWYQYYRECARKLRLILRIIDHTGIAKDESLMNTVIGEAHRDMRKLADLLDPEEKKEWFTHRKRESITSKSQQDWNKRRRELYSWSKRAEKVGIPPLPAHRPSASQRLVWETSIIKAEKQPKSEKGTFNVGEYKHECIDKLRYIKKGDTLVIENRIYQTVYWWTMQMKNTMNGFKDKIFHVEEIDHNTQKIWRVK